MIDVLYREPEDVIVDADADEYNETYDDPYGEDTEDAAIDMIASITDEVIDAVEFESDDDLSYYEDGDEVEVCSHAPEVECEDCEDEVTYIKHDDVADLVDVID